MDKLIKELRQILIMLQPIIIAASTSIVGGLLTGALASKEAAKLYWRNVGIVGLSAFASAALVTQFMQPPVAAVSCPSAPPVSKSVSDVTVQLGRYAGGIDYPGQLTGGTATNGDLIYVD